MAPLQKVNTLLRAAQALRGAIDQTDANTHAQLDSLIQSLLRLPVAMLGKGGHQSNHQRIKAMKNQSLAFYKATVTSPHCPQLLFYVAAGFLGAALAKVQRHVHETQGFRPDGRIHGRVDLMGIKPTRTEVLAALQLAHALGERDTVGTLQRMLKGTPVAPDFSEAEDALRRALS